MNGKKVCVIIPNWNGKKVLKKCLESLNKINYKKYKIILVDNGSKDKSVAFVKRKYPKIDVISLDKNYGFCYAINRGMELAKLKYNPDYILSFNNDAEITDPNFLKEIINFVELDKSIGIVGFKIIGYDNKLQFVVYGERVNGKVDSGYDYIKEAQAVSGVAMLISKKVIEKIGQFDELFFYGRDDLDYCFRARKNGFKVIYYGKIKIKHYGGYSFELSHENEYLQRCIQKGLIIFSFKNLSFRQKIFSIIRVLLDSVITKRDKDKQIHYLNIKIRKGALKRVILAIGLIYSTIKELKARDIKYTS